MRPAKTPLSALRTGLKALALICGLTAFWAADTAQAAPEDVICLQNQLNAAGFAAGPADGILGPRTRAAFDQLQSAFGIGVALPLHDVSALVACHRIGLARPELRRYWPARQRRVTFHIGPGIADDLATAIRTHGAELHEAAFRRLGVEPAGTDLVLTATNPAELERLVRTHNSFVFRAEAYQEACGHSVFGGLAAPGITILCANPELTLGGALTLSEVRYVLAHELTHLVQFQIAGAAAPNLAVGRRQQIQGPLWLIEGIAEVVSFSLTTGASLQEYRAFSVDQLGKGPLPALESLAGRGALAENAEARYRMGTIATVDLIATHGYERIGRFFTALGNSADFDTAFEESFGRSPAAFYDAFPARLGRASP